MNIPNNLNVDRVFKEIEKKAPTIGTAYGILAPLAETSIAVGDSPLDAIWREISAVFENPRMPSISGIKDWWTHYAKGTAKNGFLIWLGGEFLGNKKISTAGINTLKGTVVAAVIGDTGQGGGAPYRPSHFADQPFKPRAQIGGNPMKGDYAI